MDERVASRTALVTSLMRARHVRRDPHRILDDSWGDRIVPESFVQRVHESALAEQAAGTLVTKASTPQDLADDLLRANSGYANVIIRSRFTEDALAEAVARGVRQYVQIGSGFDSYCLRHRDSNIDLQVFEVDHPATQSLKIQCIQAACGSLPKSAHFVAADLGKEGAFEALSRTSFNPSEPAFYSWLGVTMYLTREANLLSLRAIAKSSAPGSELVFTYLDEQIFESAKSDPSGRFAVFLKKVAALGEPFLSGFDAAKLEESLAAEGLQLVEDINDVQAASRYDPNGANGFQGNPLSRIARALIAGVNSSPAA